jgi:hypothetical protein
MLDFIYYFNVYSICYLEKQQLSHNMDFTDCSTWLKIEQAFDEISPFKEFKTMKA